MVVSAMKQYTLLKAVSFIKFDSWSVRSILGTVFSYNQEFKLVTIDRLITRSKTQVDIQDNQSYKRVKIKLYNGGVFLRDVELGENIGTKKQFLVKEGQFLLSKIDARNGAFGLATKAVNNAIITADFLAFDINQNLISAEFLVLITTTKQFMAQSQAASKGTTGRQRINELEFLNVKIPLPTLKVQKQLVSEYQAKIDFANDCEKQAQELEQSIETYLYNELGILKANSTNSHTATKLLNFTKFSKISNSWSLKLSRNLSSNLYDVVNLSENRHLLRDIYRGKSPKYSESSTCVILNQKCNRWDEVDFTYAKGVDNIWLNSIDRKLFTQKNDVLINSTGEGTIGRATVVMKDVANFLYDSHLLLLRINNELLNSKFFVIFINSSLGQKQISSVKSANSTKQTELGIDNCKKILFPLPPLVIQNKIAEHITNIKSQIRELKKLAVDNRANAILDFEKAIFHNENN